MDKHVLITPSESSCRVCMDYAELCNEVPQCWKDDCKTKGLLIGFSGDNGIIQDENGKLKAVSICRLQIIKEDSE